MRQIKFRAWDTDTKTMCIPQVQCSFNSGRYDINTLFAEHSKEFVWMQFTGLKDKNGKEIYEGDVVKHREREVGNLEVKFWNGEWIGEANDTAAQPLFDEDWWRKSKGADKITNIEVVGNIYMNSELLK